MNKKVNEESIETLRKMMKEIDEKSENTEKEVKERKAIFRAIEVISAYNNGYIIDK